MQKCRIFVRLFTKSCIFGCPVRLELTTHGLTAKKKHFLRSLKAFILKEFSVFLFSPYFSPKSLGFNPQFELFFQEPRQFSKFTHLHI